jgi:hypothetical protein
MFYDRVCAPCMSKRTHLEALKKFEKYNYSRIKESSNGCYLSWECPACLVRPEVSYGLVEPNSNEAIVWRNEPVSKLQARCW